MLISTEEKVGGGGSEKELGEKEDHELDAKRTGDKEGEGCLGEGRTWGMPWRCSGWGIQSDGHKPHHLCIWALQAIMRNKNKQKTAAANGLCWAISTFSPGIPRDQWKALVKPLTEVCTCDIWTEPHGDQVHNLSLVSTVIFCLN